MAQPTTNSGDNFHTWRINTNTVSSNVGDPADLDTTDKTSTVAAINELKTEINNSGDALAYAIALG